MNIYTVRTIAEADAVTLQDVREWLTLESARIYYELHRQIPRNGTEPVKRINWPGEGDWMIDDLLGECAVLLRVDVADFEPKEKDWAHALRLPTTRRYIEWFRSGLQAPPVTIYRTERGNLRASDGRRRWLAAREAGRSWLWAWYMGPPHPETMTRSLWWLPEHGRLTREAA